MHPHKRIDGGLTKTIEKLAVDAFPLVVRTCRNAIIPKLKSQGIQVVSAGADLGEVVTNADLDASRLFLGGISLRGSFTEEHDSPARTESLEIYQNDPLDGSGDAKKGIEINGRLASPTNLTSLLRRSDTIAPFEPVGGLIYHILGEFGIISDGSTVLIGKAGANGEFIPVPFDRLEPRWQPGVFVQYNHRLAYPQHVAHTDFPAYLAERNILTNLVPTGGAGLQALQLLRSVLELKNPDDIPAFSELDPLDIVFNCQPDWKCWDTDPTSVIVRALGLPDPTDVFGNPLTANAALADPKKNMVHHFGCVFATRAMLAGIFTEAAREFSNKFPQFDLLSKNY